MTLSIELKISSILSMNLSPQKLSEHLSKEILSSQYSLHEQDSLISALIQMGFYKQSLSIIIRRIKNSQPIPWKQLLFLLWKFEVSLSQENIDAIFRGANEQNQMEALSFKQWEVWGSRFKELRLDMQDKRKKEHQKTLQQLQDKFDLLYSQKLYDEAKKISNQLKSLSPQNKAINEQLRDIRNIWSKNIISNSSRNKRLIFPVPKEDQQLQELTLELFKFIREKNISDKKQLYNLALLFKFVEAPSFSLKLIEGLRGLAVDWLRVETYLDDQKYLMVLEEIYKIEQRYFDNPDTSFSVVYTKAIALKHLDQIPAAITLMEKITHIKPQYRSALLYLKNWKLL